MERTAFPPAPSRRRASLAAVAFSYARILLALVRNIGIVPVFLAYIPFREYGAWLGTGGVLATLILARFGLVAVLPQRTGEAYGAGDRRRLEDVLGTGLVTAAAISILLAVIGAALSPLVRLLSGLDGEAGSRLAVAFAIAAAAIGVNTLAEACAGVMRSFQRSFPPGAVGILADVAGIVVSIVLVVRGLGLYGIALGLVAKSATEATLNLLFCLRTARVELGIVPRWSGQHARELFGTSIYQFLTTAAKKVQVSLDPIVVLAVLGPEMSGMYVLTVRAHETVRMVAGGLGGALVPSMAHLHGGGGKERFRDVTAKLLGLQSLIAAVGLGGVVACNASFVPLWVGDGKFAGHAVTLLFAAYAALNFLNSVWYDAMISMGRFRRVCGAVWIAAGVRIPMLLALVFVGLWGVPLAALASEVLLLVLLTRMGLEEMQVPRDEARTMAAGVARTLLAGSATSISVLAAMPLNRDWTGLVLRAILFLVPCLAWLSISERRFLGGLARELREARAAAPKTEESADRP